MEIRKNVQKKAEAATYIVLYASAPSRRKMLTVNIVY